MYFTLCVTFVMNIYYNSNFGTKYKRLFVKCTAVNQLLIIKFLDLLKNKITFNIKEIILILQSMLQSQPEVISITKIISLK